MIRVFCIIAIFCCAVLPLQAGEYYIAPINSLRGDGSIERPFGSVESAMAKVGGRHTFIFKPGYYTGQITIPPKYSGTPQHPTILKSQQKYKAILNGSLGHMIYATEDCNWVIIDGFDISGAWYTGVKLGGDYSVVRNCRIHNNAFQGIEAHSRNNIVIERNLIEYNGKTPQFDHGIYADGNNLVVRQNIVRCNSGCGIHLNQKVANSLVENNLVYGNGGWAVLLSATPQIGANRIINNTIVYDKYGLAIGPGYKDTIINNIIVTADPESKAMPLIHWGKFGWKDEVIEYNLIRPVAADAGKGCFSDDPQFADPRKGIFFLKNNSPAIKKGCPTIARSVDFFGRIRDPNHAMDLGCYTYDAALITPGVFEQLYYLGWTYHSAAGKDIPDLWKYPEESAKTPTESK